MANVGWQVVPIPATGTVSGRARKESVTDTEGYAAGTVTAGDLTLFSNFSTFATSTLVAGTTKVLGRDTNLQGAQGLPTGHLFYWYGWRLKLRTLGANLTTLANVGVSEQLNRLRELSSTLFKFTAGEYIRCQSDELPSGTGPAFVNTTHASSTIFSLPSGIPDRKNAKDITISGKPQEIVALEAFRHIQTFNPGPTWTLTLTVDVYVSALLDGILVRGVA